MKVLEIASTKDLYGFHADLENIKRYVKFYPCQIDFYHERFCVCSEKEVNDLQEQIMQIINNK